MILVLVIVATAAVLLLLGAPYVPTHQSELDQIFDELGDGTGRVFADLGSGDGRVLKRAKAQGFEVVGFEINPILWLLSKLRLGWTVGIQLRPWQHADLSEIDIIYMFSTSWHLQRISVGKLPDTATIIIYGPQPKDFADRQSRVCGSAIIYQPVAQV